MDVNIKELYEKGINIQKYFKEIKGTKENDIDSILYSYDFQAGSYTREYFDEEVMKDKWILNGRKVDMTRRQVVELRSQYIAEELKTLHAKTILEVGTGEGTNLCDIVLRCDKEIQFSGLELALSRLLYAQKFADLKKVNIDFVCGNMFSLPYKDNSFDVIFLNHCLESNTGKEKEALKELLRGARKYIILLEPSYELGNEESRRRIKELDYITNLQQTLQELNLNVIRNELFPISSRDNNTAITIIEKERGKIETQTTGDSVYACPKCKKGLKRHREAYYCPECFSLYPVFHNIPVLNPDNAVLCSKYESDDCFFFFFGRNEA